MVLAALVLLALVCINASYYQWDGGWATGPRHVVPALGFVGLTLGFAFESPNTRGFAAAAAGLSIMIMVLTTAIGLEAPADGDALFDYLVPAVREGLVARVSGASNLGLLLGLGRKASLVPILLWISIGAAGLFWLSLNGPSGRRPPKPEGGGEPEGEERD